MIALIKLSKPQMETNVDALLDRIRVLEEKMEQGIPAVVQQIPVKGERPSGEALKEKPKPAKAAPEDLRRVRAEWKFIIAQVESGLLRQYLHRSIPKYNGETGEPKLFIEFQDKNAQRYLGNEEVKQ